MSQQSTRSLNTKQNMHDLRINKLTQLVLSEQSVREGNKFEPPKLAIPEEEKGCDKSLIIKTSKELR